MTAPSWDAAVVGGGPVGAALAGCLGAAGMRVAVVEGGPRPGPPPGEGLRVSALTLASEELLRALGAWQRLEAPSPFRAMRVWDAVGDGAIAFEAEEAGEAALGHIVENADLVHALWGRLEALETVDLLPEASLSGLSREGGRWRLRLADGRELRARLLVGADGARSRVRRLARIPLAERPYGHAALVAPVATERPHRATAWQRFLPTGPLAFLPLADGRCSIVWSTGEAAARRLLALEEGAFRRELGEAFGHALGEVTAVGRRACFPLAMRHAQRYVDEGLALVGDAAHTIHPLAGQGVNLGLLDAAALAETVLEARAAGRDFAARRVLRRYERARRGHNQLMLAAMDAFRLLFAPAAGPVPWIRSRGLELVDGASPLKTWIVRFACGRAGELPALARPGGAASLGLAAP